jgi:hypothetical protein
VCAKCFQLQRGNGSFFLQVLFHILNGSWMIFNDVFTFEVKVLLFSLPLKTVCLAITCVVSMLSKLYESMSFLSPYLSACYTELTF